MNLHESEASSDPAVPPDSVALFRKAKGGDAQASEALFERYSPWLHGLARRRMGAQIRELAESGDVAQEALLEAVSDLPQLEIQGGRSHLRRLFARLVHHRISALWRHHHAERRDRQREQALDPDWEVREGGASAEPTAPEPGPLDQVLDLESGRLLRECLAELDPVHAKVIELRSIQRLPWHQVAHELGRPSPDAARMLHRRAVLEIRSALRRRRLPLDEAWPG
jgi:RNA polymerase sigma-70 factor (ECF subfamily)